MEKFTVLNGVAAPMLMENINTDLIAPSLMLSDNGKPLITVVSTSCVRS